ncbi:MAG: A/G-specific adenine glycosylase [Chlamydiae bacterium]|nr:A/G-specific adenine glycosylase [Chlamydiota bacterium]
MDFFRSNQFNTSGLISWFSKEKRNFPWRKSSNFYQVWVSEVMLQQTRAEVVVPYYMRWMKKFPTIKSLAQAAPEEVIKMWEGLGYYSRARALHEGAKYIAKNYGENPPPEELTKIKGIGPYTLGAILSFAFHKKAPAIDGNVSRVIARHFLIEDDLSKQRAKQLIKKQVLSILPDDQPWVAMEALIELGAVICTKKPDCLLCPIRSTCAAFKHGKQDKIPFTSTQVSYQNIYRLVGIICCENEYLIYQESMGKVMGGLYQFPYLQCEKEEISKDHLKNYLQRIFPSTFVFAKKLQDIHHTFTRYKANLFPFLWQTSKKEEIKGYSWISAKKMHSLPFCSGHRQIMKQLM